MLSIEKLNLNGLKTCKRKCYHVEVMNVFARGWSAEDATLDVIEKQLPALKEEIESERLRVDNIDVFCELGVFNIDQTRRILEEGNKLGLNMNFHGDELHPMKAAEVSSILVLVDNYTKKRDVCCVNRHLEHNGCTIPLHCTSDLNFVTEQVDGLPMRNVVEVPLKKIIAAKIGLVEMKECETILKLYDQNFKVVVRISLFLKVLNNWFRVRAR